MMSLFSLTLETSDTTSRLAGCRATPKAFNAKTLKPFYSDWGMKHTVRLGQKAARLPCQLQSQLGHGFESRQEER